MEKTYSMMVQGKMNFMGIEIPVVSGGFGEGKMCILAKTVAEIHGVALKTVNQNIKNNEKRFKDGIDIIDLKNSVISNDSLLEKLGYSKQSIANSKNIYLLSERGYAKLIKIMDDDKSWEVHDKLVDDYFSLRDKFQQTQVPQISRKEQSILTIFSDSASLEEKIGATETLIDISRGEICNSVINLEVVEDLIIETLKDEEIINHMSRLTIREAFHKTLFRLGYITYRQFPTKDGKRLEKVYTKVPTESFNEVFRDSGMAVVRSITGEGDDNRGKVEIKFTKYIVKWLHTEQFKETYLKVASNMVIVPQIDETMVD